MLFPKTGPAHTGMLALAHTCLPATGCLRSPQHSDADAAYAVSMQMKRLVKLQNIRDIKDLNEIKAKK